MWLFNFLLIVSLPNTLICYGNTRNGLGMMVGYGYVEIGIYENEEIKDWKIQSYPDEGYYEEIRVDNQVRFVKVEKTSNGRFQYEIKLDQGKEKGVFGKDDKKLIFGKLRSNLWKGFKPISDGVTFKKSIVKEKGKDYEIEIKITKSGQAIFKETRKRHDKKKLVIYQVENLLRE